MVALFGLMFVGIGVVRLMTPPPTEWAPPLAFGLAWLALAARAWRSAFGQGVPRLRRDDLTRTRLDRALLALTGLATLAAILPLMLGEHPTPNGGMEGAAPGWVLLLLLAVGAAIVVESCRKAREDR